MKEGYIYDYTTAAREYCASQGMVFPEEWVPEIDKAFNEIGLEQDQVDRLMREYIWRVKYLFSPSSYTRWQRIKIALHFLRG